MEWMKTQLTRVVQAKYNTKKDLAYLKNKYISIIFGGLSKQESIKTIHKKLYNETIKQKKAGFETSSNMLNFAFKISDTLNKQTQNISFIKNQVKMKYGIASDTISSILGFYLFDLIKKKKVENKMSKIITKEADKSEGKSKDKIIKNVLENNIDISIEETKKSDEKIDLNKIMIFYLASAHKDSAIDHKDWQGKIYIDNNWENIVMPYELHNEISKFIKTNNIKTIQWVTGRPVRFITRPNCRHYFKELSVKDVFENSAKNLLNKYKMDTAIGDRQYLQTIKHSTNKEWYNDVRNAQLLLKSYKERLQMHEMMYSENPCAILKSAIEKDKMLIEKWEKYINEKQKK